MVRLWSIVHALTAFCLIILFQYKTCVTQRVSFISTEHPRLSYYNKKYIAFANASSRRFGRRDRRYYLDLHVETLVELNNNYMWDMFYYEFLTNVYKPTFVEMHYRTCDLISKDQFFGPSLRRVLKKCPLPVGVYHLQNISVPIENIPAGFPFTKGRIYVNSTHAPTKEVVITGYIDMELKQYTIKK